MCSVRPLSSSSTWGTNSTIASRDSTAPLGDPGRLTIRTRPRVPATDRESTGLAAARAHQFAQAGDFAVDHRPRGFRRDIPWGHAGAAGGEDGGDLAAVRQRGQAGADLRGLVGDGFHNRDAPAQLFQPFTHGGAGTVGARAGAHGIADGQDRGVSHDLSCGGSPRFSRRSFRAGRDPGFGWICRAL